MEALTDGREKGTPPPTHTHMHNLRGREGGGHERVYLRTSNCGEIDIAYHVYMLTQGQAHFNWILSSTLLIIGVYYLARAKHNEIN